MPSRAEVPTTGTPSSPLSFARSTRTPLRRASSSRFTQTTRSGVSSSTWSTRFRLRSRQVASQTATAQSGLPERRKSLAASSSAEWACKE